MERVLLPESRHERGSLLLLELREKGGVVRFLIRQLQSHRQSKLTLTTISDEAIHFFLRCLTLFPTTHHARQRSYCCLAVVLIEAGEALHYMIHVRHRGCDLSRIGANVRCS